tara:strand:+ start:681 stop:854 length:174 start_codon:yes stop_codon:yes gene_type:complete
MIRENWEDKKVTVELSRGEVLEIILAIRNDLRNLPPNADDTRRILTDAMRAMMRAKR